ncbi:MAG: NAD-dependent DNA ligase LigA [Bacteroidota bacterium]|nr:NAD-dependent DNA ligase LigA [Bacteroidota bacterium]
MNETPTIDPTYYTQLQLVLRFHEWKYYVQDEGLISDFEYDQLYKLLEKTEQEHPDWLTEDSPTQRVSSDLGKQNKSVAHLDAMLSLDNTYTIQDLQDFDQRVKKLCELSQNDDIEYIVEPKFDGGSLAVVYEKDQLIRAATRGDGTKGEEMTANARTIRSLPLKAGFSKLGLRKVELRGEAIIRKDLFQKLNEQRELDGLPQLANPRNAATGVLRVKDPKETASRSLDMFIFQFGYAKGIKGENGLDQFKTQEELIQTLADLGFKVARDEKKRCANIQEVYGFIEEWAKKRDHYEYELDGMVVKVNDLKLQERCGFTSHHPRWAVAYKFAAKQATSKLIAVEYQVGKIGSITPVAKIEPVQLAGVTVSSISLHNEDFIKSRDLHYGDTVLVERAGDVIPYIVKSFPELRPNGAEAIRFPSLCPVCKTPLEREADESAWRCPNDNCEAQIIQRLIHHVSKEAMDIDGFGASIVERFYKLGWIKSMADMYQLNFEDISKLEGMGLKSAEKLRMSIEIAKKNPIHRLLHSLCIHHLGKKVSKLIAENLPYVLELENWNLENYTSIKDVGPVVGKNIIYFFSSEENRNMLQKMELLGVNMKQTAEDKPKALNIEGSLFGKTILFTGTLSKMGRKEAQDKAERAGAKILSAVSSQLNILVVGEDAGSKLEKAKKLGTVQVWTEDEFISYL